MTHRMMDYSSRAAWPSITEIISMGEGANIKFWLALQIGHLFRSLPYPGEFRRALTELEKACYNQGFLRHMLSIAYKWLQAEDETERPEFIRNWARDLALELTDKQIEQMIVMAHKSTVSGRIQEMNYKILSRWYLTPGKLSKIFPACVPCKWKEMEAPGIKNWID